VKTIAIYGKGGIGKSTISVNLAFALSARGKQVFLVGCDPKQDTTRLLGGEIRPSVIDSYEDISDGVTSLDDITVAASFGHDAGIIKGIEIGGPRPGVGCAGRGILLALELLTEKHFFTGTDVVIYDVLGDVVCGGFASPVSRNYAEEVYIVTSGQTASLFAANNLIGGIKNVGSQAAGLIFNEKGFLHEKEVVIAFAEQIGIPITAEISNSPCVPECEMKKQAIVNVLPESKEANQFFRLADESFNSSRNNCTQSLSVYDFYKHIESIRRKL
jgi:nitrogenase iron protein NifH